eukprot:NODE_3777_length_743_cov_332.888081.p1 GENE.NODE_3777_length_743_cov_332.888081~~NODE_3777_length_743_cov_332.888081.p1  ORF type:complete len:185 (-),score=35.77 NODE_3777_length_743_cov_332.888081:174-674(-)
MSPLPPASYHITVQTIASQYKLRLDDATWAARLRESRWAVMVRELEEAAFVPAVRFSHVSVWDGGVSVELEADESKSTRKQPSHTHLAELAGFPEEPQYTWHFTLAYCVDRGAFNACEPAAIEADRAAINAAVAAAFRGDLVPLEPARLCRCEDMTAFTPWDGVTL